MLKRRIPNRLTMAHGLMVLAGLVTFVTVSAVLRDRSAAVEVLVAADELSAGTLITSNDLAIVSVAADSPVLPGLVEAGTLIEGRLVRDIVAGQPLLANDLLTERAQVARTMAIPVNAVASSGLGLRVGDSVDVIGVGPDGALTFVLSGASITRLPTTSTAGGAFNQTSREPFITIEVDEESALLLAEALRDGDIEIVRSSGATEVAS